MRAIETIQDQIHHLDERIRDRLLRLERQQEQITIPLNAISTILLSEHSTARKELSNRINAETEKRLRAEDLARRHTLGEI